MTLFRPVLNMVEETTSFLGLDRGAQVGNAHFWKRISAQALTLGVSFGYASGPGIPPTPLDFGMRWMCDGLEF